MGEGAGGGDRVCAFRMALQVKDLQMPTKELPPFDGIGANEFIVTVTKGLTDFISTVDTPYTSELNIWYHTLNAGYKTRISGETDFPCIYGEKVGRAQLCAAAEGGLHRLGSRPP